MANRFTATEKWDKAWFCDLQPLYKLFFIYLCDNCNNAGIWDVNWAKVKFYVGAEGPIDPGIFGIRDDGKPRVIALSKSNWFIHTFILFQQKIDSIEDLNPDNNSHKQIIKILQKEGVFTVSHSNETIEGLASPKLAPAKPLARGSGIGIGKGNNKTTELYKDYAHFQHPKFTDAYTAYLGMRKKIRKPATIDAEKLALEKLHKHTADIAVKMLNQSVLNSWQGIFEFKEDPKNNQTTSSDHDQLIESALGKIATKDAIKAVLSQMPVQLWWKVDAFLKKRYPGGGGGFGTAKRELEKEMQINPINDLVNSVLKQ